jgi:hypothetical protein
MAQPMVVEQSRVISVGQKEAFLGVLQMNVPTIFWRWYGPFPPINRVIGDFQVVGDARTLKFAGGGSAREELVRLDSPNSFGYELSDIKGPLALLASGVQGEWTFEPVDSGTKATWRWTVHPRSALSTPMLPLFGRLWRGYADQSLKELSDQLVH